MHERRAGREKESTLMDRVRTGWRIRPPVASDRPAVEALLREADLPIEGIDTLLEQSYVVAERDGRVIGSAGLETYGHYGLLRSLVVSAEHRSVGLGAALTMDRLAQAKEDKLDAVYLLTFVPAYFTRFGFGEVSRDRVPAEIRASAEFAAICPDTATVMARSADVADETLRREVRERYAEIVREVKRASHGGGKSCCSGGATHGARNEITADLYSAPEMDSLPADAVAVSLGCGNPTALAELRSGEVVLDLGSGGGIDVILSARRVGSSGKAYGLDMTDEMLEVARENQRKAGVTNVEFLKGEIEAIPLPDHSVDVIISNCVINLSADKRRALGEAFRVLKPGGRFAVSDIITRGPLPEAVRRDIELWAGCVAGAMQESEYRAILADVGFDAIDVEITREYGTEEGCAAGTGIEALIMSAFIRARKPA